MGAQPVVLITGASSGIGEASARLFAAAGYRVALAARRRERLEALADEIQAAGGAALAVTVDVAELAAVQHLAQTVLDQWGQVDVLFNNAGKGRMDWLDQLDPQAGIHEQILVNLLGTIQVTRAFLPGMIERRSGHIINMASMGGWVATPTYSVYAASKFGVRGFSEALRREVRVFGIQVSVIYPGGVRTEFKDHAGIRRKTGYTTPKALLLESEQVAQAVLGLVRRPRRTVILPPLMRLSIWMNFFFPGLVDRVLEKKFTIPERME